MRQVHRKYDEGFPRVKSEGILERCQTLFSFEVSSDDVFVRYSSENNRNEMFAKERKNQVLLDFMVECTLDVVEKEVIDVNQSVRVTEKNEKCFASIFVVLIV
jgi:hypothetical protein